MADEAHVRIRSDADVVAARQEARAMAARLGLSSIDQTLLATAISEIARNMVQYARGGDIRLAVVRRGDRRGLEVRAEDQGPGIADLERAMQDGYSTGQGMGMGLPGTRRMMDDFEISSEVGRGTRVTMRKWAR